MNYLVIKNNTITQLCTSEEILLEYLEVNLTVRGVVEIGSDKKYLPTSYNMEFSREEVMNDIITHQLKRIEVMLQIGIYKLERI